MRERLRVTLIFFAALFSSMRSSGSSLLQRGARPQLDVRRGAERRPLRAARGRAGAPRRAPRRLPARGGARRAPTLLYMSSSVARRVVP
jgi:hypothetical protein